MTNEQFNTIMAELKAIRSLMTAGKAPAESQGSGSVRPPDGPQPGEGGLQMDPLEWARRNPDLARQYALDVTAAQIGMHRAPETPERDAAIAREMEAYENRYWPGNIELGGLTEVDAAYFANMAEPYYRKTGQDIRWAGVVGGWTGEINAFRSLGEAWRNNYPADQYVGKLRAIVEGMLRG
jgi:hypothetical protein